MAAHALQSTCASPIAILASPSGDMHFFTSEALKIWADMKASLRSILPPSPSAAGASQVSCLDGFDIHQWAAYAKKKSSIATNICRLNGALKLQRSQVKSDNDVCPPAQDDIFTTTDPWLNAKMPPPLASLDVEADLWSGWGQKLCEPDSNLQAASTIALFESALTPVGNLKTNDTSATAGGPLEDGVNASLSVEDGAGKRKCNRDDEQATFGKTIVADKLHDTMIREALESTSVTYLPDDEDPKPCAGLCEPCDVNPVSASLEAGSVIHDIPTLNVKYDEANAPSAEHSADHASHRQPYIEDIPGKSWDQKKLLKLWNKIPDEEAADKVGYWLKDRYANKFGSPTKNMDKAVAALSDIELNAVMNYCRTLDTNLLEIPFYQVVNPAEHESCATDELHKPCPIRIVKDPQSTCTVKLAGVTKRGMAQPSHKRR